MSLSGTPKLTIQIRSYDLKVIGNALDDLRIHYKDWNIAVSRINTSKSDPQVYLCYLSVYERLHSKLNRGDNHDRS